MKKIDKFVILDLFCGAGGFSYGLHRNNHFTTGVAVDFNEKAAHTFKMNMPETCVITGDITNPDTKKKIIDESLKAGVNMIIGGPPCQGFSMKGKKLGLQDERNFLFREYLNLVKELQPEVFVIENVKSLLSTAGGWFRDEILSYISVLGYKVNYGILNSKKFGVPQGRERAIFICSKNLDISLPVGDDNLVSVRDAISDLAYLQSGEGDFESDYRIPAQSDYQRMMRDGSHKLYNHKASAHSQVALDKLALIPAEKGKEFLPDELKGKQKFNTTWGRLTWDNISPTIDTRFDTPSNGTNSHPVLNRAITPREAARIQSFDDKFVFYGSKVYIRTQIGNAVPPLMAKAIGDEIWSSYEDMFLFSRQSDKFERELDENFKKEHGIFYTDLELSKSIVKFLNIPRNVSAIDPSCGSGSFVHMMRRAGVRDVVGCDFDSATVEQCRRLTGCQNIFQCDTLGNDGSEILRQIRHDQFDFVVGNPPYAPISGDVRLNASGDFQRLVRESGNNLYIAAIYRTFEIAKQGGVISLVIPKNLLHIPSYAALRNTILRTKTILSIIELGIHFKTVRGEQIVLTMLNKLPSEGHVIKYYTYNKGVIKYMSEVSQSFYNDQVIVFTGNQEITLYKALKTRYPKLRAVCPVDIKRGRSHSVVAIRGKQIKKFGIKDCAMPDMGSQIFIQNIFAAEAGITAAYGGNLEAKETVTIVTLHDKKTAKYILGLLHSRLCNYYLIRFCFNNSRLTIHTDAQYLYDIPIVVNTLFFEDVVDIVEKLETVPYLSTEWFDLNEQLNDIVYDIFRISEKSRLYIESEMRKISSKKWYGDELKA